MGIKLFSSTTTKHYTSDQNTTPNPNKHNFSVETEKKDRKFINCTCPLSELHNI